MQAKKQQNQTWNNGLVKTGKAVHQGCILSPCWFNLYAGYITQNARLDESQAGMKMARRNYQQPQICRWYHSKAESKEKLKSLLMKVKEESKKAGLELNIHDFPGGLVVKTGSSQCRSSQYRFNPWSRNLISHGATKTQGSQISKLFLKVQHSKN